MDKSLRYRLISSPNYPKSISSHVHADIEYEGGTLNQTSEESSKDNSGKSIYQTEEKLILGFLPVIKLTMA